MTTIPILEAGSVYFSKRVFNISLNFERYSREDLLESITSIAVTFGLAILIHLRQNFLATGISGNFEPPNIAAFIVGIGSIRDNSETGTTLLHRPRDCEMTKFLPDLKVDGLVPGTANFRINFINFRLKTTPRW